MQKLILLHLVSGCSHARGSGTFSNLVLSSQKVGKGAQRSKCLPAGSTEAAMEIDSIVRIAVVALIAGGMFLGWILLLGGVSAVQEACDSNCRYLTGLTWWILWLQLFVYIFAVPVQVCTSPHSHLLVQWKG